MPVVSIRHATTYRYRKPVGFGEHRMMLRPLEAFDQRLLSTDLTISPEPCLLRRLHDVSDATVDVARFAGRADRLVFESRALVDHSPGVDFELEAGWLGPGADGLYGADEALALAASIRRRHADAGEVADWARRFLPSPGRARASTVLTAMAHAIRADFTYALRLRGAPQAPQRTIETGEGSCRDFAVLMMEAARSLGLAARFVTGYVYSTSPDAGRTGGGHTHAWTRICLPGCGWVDFDPTNGIIGNIDLIRVAAVDDPRLAAPLHGACGEAGDYLGMDVSVEINAEPEVQRIPHLRVAASR